jgi:ribosome-associated toxin RatA of RatAB toxin-antitoxin module
MMKLPGMSGHEPVQRSQVLARATPAEVYEVVTDFTEYPRLFPEMKATRVISKNGGTSRVEFRAQVVLPVRYVLDLACDRAALAVDWTFVEGEIVVGSAGGWRFTAEGADTRLDYRASIQIRAPLPGFMLRKITDGLVAASLPGMFGAIEREVRKRQTLQTHGSPAT